MTDILVNNKMMKISFVPAIVMLILTLYLPVSAGEKQYTLVDMNDEEIIRFSNGALETETVHDAEFSVKYEKQTDTSAPLKFPVSLSDWSGYDNFQVNIYSKGNTCSELMIVAVSYNDSDTMRYKLTVDWRGWRNVTILLKDFIPRQSGSDFSNIREIQVYSRGWEMTPNYNAVIYFDSMYLGSIDSAFGVTASKDILLNMDDKNTIGSYPADLEITKNASRSLIWNQSEKKHIDFTSLAYNDWTNYSHLTIWVYSEQTNNSQFLIQAMSDGFYYRYIITLDWTGWNQISIPLSKFISTKSDAVMDNIIKVSFWAEGWGMNVDENTVLRIDNMYLENIIDENGSKLVTPLSSDAIIEIGEWASDLTVWHYGNNFVYKNGERILFEDKNTYIRKGTEVYLPKDMFEFMTDCLAVNIPGTIAVENEEYIPVNQAAEVLGIKLFVDGKFIFFADKSLQQYSKYNEIKQLCTKSENKLSKITDIDCLELLEKWENFLTGADSADSDIKIEKVNQAEYYAGFYQETMGMADANKPSSAGTYIHGFWNMAIETTSNMNEQFVNLYKMALGYKTPNTSTYLDVSLKEDILYILNWLYENLYGEDEINNTGWRDTTEFNWYHWQIGVPNSLADTLLLMRDDILQTDMEKYLRVIDYFAKYKSASGANLVDTVYPVLISSLLKKDISAFLEACAYLEEDMKYADSKFADGIQPDGSYRYHNFYAMNGSYGVTYLNKMSTILNLLVNTDFELSGSEKDDFLEWTYIGYGGILYQGRAMSIFRGRSPGGERYVGTQITDGLIKILPLMDNAEQENIRYIIKSNFKNGSKNYTLSNMSYYSIPVLYQIAEDTEIPQMQKNNMQVFYNTDKAVWKNGNFAVAVSMSSSRTSGWESINDQNKTGWYQGDGATYIYDNNSANFEDDYWRYVDPYMLPGITADEQERQAISIKDSEVYKSSKNFTGGVSVEGLGTLAMELESFHNEKEGYIEDDYGNSLPLHDNDLVAKKAWFLFDNEIVALGAGITSTMNSSVKTVIENRITDNDTVLADTKEVEESPIELQKYAVISGTGGYIPSEGQDVKIKKETNTREFTKIWIEHGKNPQNESYAYTILPGADEESTARYYNNPQTQILSNTNSIQAVYDSDIGATGYVFWESGQFNGLEVSKPMIVLTKETDDVLILAAQDPTQTLTDAQVFINGRYRVKDAVRCTYDKNVITIDFSTKDGSQAQITLEKILDLEAFFESGNIRVVNNTQVQQDFISVEAQFEGETLKNVLVNTYSLDSYQEILINSKQDSKILLIKDWQTLRPVKINK